VSTTLIRWSHNGQSPDTSKVSLVRHDDNNVFPCIRAQYPIRTLYVRVVLGSERARKKHSRLPAMWTPAHYILGVLGAVLAAVAGVAGLTAVLGKTAPHAGQIRLSGGKTLNWAHSRVFGLGKTLQMSPQEQNQCNGND
jgi:hypothetical protein